ncbi:MAG: peptidylprolyl isomerase [Planctomycetota bacterium]
MIRSNSVVAIAALSTLLAVFALPPSVLAAQEPAKTPTRKTTPDPYFTKPDSHQTKKTDGLQPIMPDRAPQSNWAAPLTPIPIVTKPAPKDAAVDATNSAFDPSTNLVAKPPVTMTPKLEFNQQTNQLPLGTSPSIGSPIERGLNQGSRMIDNGSSIIRQKPLEPLSPVQPTVFNAPEKVSRQTFQPGQVLALVGGEPIFVADMMFEINQMIEKHMSQAPESIKQRERINLIPRMLPKFVEAKILFQGATSKLPEEVDLEKVIEQASEEFDEKALAHMMESSGVKTVAEFDAQLRGQGSSLRHLRRAWSIEQLTKIFVAQQISKIPEVTHRDLLDKYQSDLAKYEFPAKARWEQVMIRFDKAGSRDMAQKQIAELSDKLVHGANFAALAQSESHGFRADEGGRHEWTTKGALVATTVDEAIFSLPIGKLSGVIESNDGLHLIRVVERNEAGRTPFLEAQVEIKRALIEQRKRKAFENYMNELRDQIPVEYLANEGK